jgi:lysozyme
MKLSEAGIKALVAREGEELRAYHDARGVPTIGVGHTGPEVHLGLVWTQEQVNSTFLKDVAWAEDEVNRMVTVPMTQNQFDALVSFTFNVGKSGFDHSSALHDFNSGIVMVANDLLKWELPPSLKARRESERKQFLTP